MTISMCYFDVTYIPYIRPLNHSDSIHFVNKQKMSHKSFTKLQPACFTKLLVGFYGVN